MAPSPRRLRPFRFVSPTVTGEWLAEHAAEVVVADVRWSLAEGPKWHAYADAHIPGAVFVDLDEDLAAPPTAGGGRHPLPDPARFAERMGALGIGDDTPVVAYDDSGGAVAARLWWLLRVLGGPAAVLDGGLAAWPGPLSGAPPVIEPRGRAVRCWPESRFCDADDLAGDAAFPPATLLLDARSPDRYACGDPTIDPRPGHIPGARNAPWNANLDQSTGRFRPRVELRRRFGALGAERASRVVAYCGSGVTACHDLLALELAGFHHTALYPGSWSAWGADPDRPAVEGPHPAT